MVDIKILTSKIEEVLDKIWDVTRENKLNIVSKLVLETLAKKDIYTVWHSIRVAKYAEMIGKKLWFDEKKMYNLRISMLLHDAWKVAIDDNVLNKAWKLNWEDFLHMKSHVNSTEDILWNISVFLDSNNKNILDWASLHHEKISGKWYPYWMKWNSWICKNSFYSWCFWCYYLKENLS